MGEIRRVRRIVGTRARHGRRNQRGRFQLARGIDIDILCLAFIEAGKSRSDTWK